MAAVERRDVMDRLSVDEAGRAFDTLVDRVVRDGVTIELEKGHRVVARLSPAGPRMPIADLNRFFAGLPSLGDDADAFADDVERIRKELPRESDPWA
jgi:antitoxin (DNA-binding transcriptional repressor) of toxin-antitoxin stability system